MTDVEEGNKIYVAEGSKPSEVPKNGRQGEIHRR